MTIIPCSENVGVSSKDIDEVAERIKTQAHTLGGHNLSEPAFYASGLFRSAIERIRGQYSATMGNKREFVQHVLNHMQDGKFIVEWESSGSANRHDYEVTLNSGDTAIIELKGCLDGNNTTIFERPPNANEFVIWSVCSNVGSDMSKNVWSGIHTRLGADIIAGKQQVVDGLIVWDWICGTVNRPCPKTVLDPSRLTQVGPHSVPPPCLYVFPATIPKPRNNPSPPGRSYTSVGLMQAFFDCFGCKPEEVYQVLFEVQNRGADVVRTTKIVRDWDVQKASRPKALGRS